MIFKIFENINELLDNKQKNYFYKLAFANFLNTFLETVSIGSIPILIALIFKIDEVKKYLPNIDVVNNFFSLNYESKFILFSVAIILIFFIKNIFSFVIVYSEGKFLKNLKIYYTKKIYNYYINLPFIKFFDYNIASIQKNIIQETKLACEYISFINIIIKETLLFFGIFALVILINPSIAFTLFLFLGLTGLIYFLLIRKKIKKYGETMEKIREFQIKSVNQTFSSLKRNKNS